MLKFDGAWRFEPPPDQALHNRTVPDGFVNDCFDLIGKVATQGSRKAMLEHFKGYFAGAAGISDSSSSSVGWAESDLRGYMSEAAANAPLFIEAFYDACEILRERGDSDFFAPDAGMINKLLASRDVGYRIEPPRLVLLEKVDHNEVVVAVPDRPPTLAEQAIEVFQRSARRSEELLSGGGHDREAVQEILWLLETVTTAFRGVDTATGTIEGKYFNQIVRELRQQAGRGTSLDRIIDWMTTLHGYLSSPAGGGVRHGLDLNRGVEISHSEARLFCNLTRSYLAFLLAEHERLATGRPRSRR